MKLDKSEIMNYGKSEDKLDDFYASNNDFS
jgi:hypothetical protein